MARIPAELADGDGTSVPAMASTAAGELGLAGSLGIGGGLDVAVVGAAAELAGITRDDAWVLVDEHVLEGHGSGMGSRLPSVLLIASEDSGPDRAALAAALDPTSTVLDRAQASARVTAGAAGTGMLRSFVVAVLVGALLSGAALVITMVIAAPARGRLFSQLRTLGFTGRQARGLATWEMVPMALVSVAFGCVLGVVIPGWCYPRSTCGRSPAVRDNPRSTSTGR